MASTAEELPGAGSRLLEKSLTKVAPRLRATGLRPSMPPAAGLSASVVEHPWRTGPMASGALRRSKQLLQGRLFLSAEEQVAMEVGFIFESFATDDFREGVTSFAEKRKPEFDAERQ